MLKEEGRPPLQSTFYVSAIKNVLTVRCGCYITKLPSLESQSIWDLRLTLGPLMDAWTNLNNFLAQGESFGKASFRLSVRSFIYFFLGSLFQKFRDWHNRQDSVSSLTGSIYISHAVSRKADRQTKSQVLSRSRSIFFAVQKTLQLRELYLPSKLFPPSTNQCSGCRSCTQKEC